MRPTSPPISHSKTAPEGPFCYEQVLPVLSSLLTEPEELLELPAATANETRALLVRSRELTCKFVLRDIESGFKSHLSDLRAVDLTADEDVYFGPADWTRLVGGHPLKFNLGSYIARVSDELIETHELLCRIGL